MSRNVVRSLSRPCARPQWRSKPIPKSVRSLHSEEATAEESPEVDEKAQNLHLLRLADQKYLYETRIQVEGTIDEIRKAKERTSSYPVTVEQLPEVPPYTLGAQRRTYHHTLPQQADRTIEALENVREHLLDLQFQPYKATEDTSVKKFWNEISTWTEEQKRERLREMDLQEEAMLARLTRSSENLLKHIREMDARHKTLKGAPKMPMPRAQNNID